MHRLPIAALLAVAIVVAVEVVVVPVARRLAWPSLWLHSQPGRDDPLRAAAQLELADTSRELIYVVGSSQGRDDIDPEQVESLLAADGVAGVEVWNLAVDGGDAIDAFLQLDAIAEKPPRLVLMIPSWVFYFDGYDPTKLALYCTSLSQLGRVAHLYGPLSFWRDARGEITDAVLANLVPSFRWARFYLSVDLFGSLLSRKRVAPERFAPDRQTDEVYFRETIARHGRRRHGVSVDTVRKRRAFEAWARELGELGTELVVIEGPLHPRAAEMRPAFLVIWEDHVNFMRSTAEGLGLSYVELGACDLDDATLFNDLGHLNARGRELFTECITRGVLRPLLR